VQLAKIKREAEVVDKLQLSPQQILSEFKLDLCSNSKQTAVNGDLSPPDFAEDVLASFVDAGPYGVWYLGRSGNWVLGRLIPRNVQESLARLERRQDEVQQIRRMTDVLVGFTDNVLLFLMLLTIFGAVWTGLALSRTIAEPVRALAKAAQRVGTGDLDVALPEEGKDELALLSRRFNAMTRDLKAGNEKIQDHATRIDRQRAYLNQLLEALPVGVLSITRDGRLRTCNSTAQAWLGMSSFDAEENYWIDAGWRSRSGELPDLLDQVRQATRAHQEELRIGSEGEGRPVKAMIVPLSDGGALAVLEDLSLLAQAEKRAAWQEVARRMAHEVKNPLTPIKLTAQRLARRVREGRLEPQTVSEGAETILTEVESLSRLVDSFTHFAKLPTPNPKPCDACEIMRQVHSLYSSGQVKEKLELLLPPNPINVTWDADMVKRALINFVDNAIHSIQDTGTITMEVGQPEGDKVRLSVRDDGTGVPPEAISKLFEPYFSTKQRGTGLGLAISRKIAEDHGGEAIYEPLTPGSMFYLELPTEVKSV
jgi:two-component system nitrogen regulation sensor histidine kinase NtrY